MIDHTQSLRRTDWRVETVALSLAKDLVAQFHYAAGGSNTATYRHGLFQNGCDICLGIAWWIPPTKSAALATYPGNWRGVLSLSRLAINPSVPKNGASFLLGKSMKLIDRERWPCLVTYADEMQGHTGQIYKATNWEACGMTKKEPTFFKDGRMIARKAGPKTRTRKEMEALGCEMVGKFAKHKYKHILSKTPLTTMEQS